MRRKAIRRTAQKLVVDSSITNKWTFLGGRAKSAGGRLRARRWLGGMQGRLRGGFVVGVVMKETEVVGDIKIASQDMYRGDVDLSSI